MVEVGVDVTLTPPADDGIPRAGTVPTRTSPPLMSPTCRRPTEADSPSNTSNRRDSPVSPFGRARHRKDSTGRPANSVPAPPPG